MTVKCCISWIGTVGHILICYGLSLAWRPLGWIVGGGLLAWAAGIALREQPTVQKHDSFAEIIERARRDGIDVTDVRTRRPD